MHEYAEPVFGSAKAQAGTESGYASTRSAGVSHVI